MYPVAKPHLLVGDYARNRGGPQTVSTQRPHHHQIKRTPPACILWLTRTSSAGRTRPTTQMRKTKPIPARPKTQMRKTNPISARPTTKNAKQTQFQHTKRPAAHYFCETNPKNNAGRRPATPIFNPGLSAGDAPRPKCAKQTQSRTGTACRAPTVQNKPNSRTPSGPPLPILAKRTQFPTTNIQSTIYNIQSPRPCQPNWTYRLTVGTMPVVC